MYPKRVLSNILIYFIRNSKQSSNGFMNSSHKILLFQ